MGRLIRVTAVFFLSLAMGFSIAHAYTVGGNPAGASVSDSYSLDTVGTLSIGGTPTVFDITYDAQAGPWVKSVTFNDGMTGSALHFMGENLQVSGTFSWTGWYTEITTSNWKFINQDTNLISALSGGGPLSGLTISLNPDGRFVYLYFDPISSPSMVSLNFPISYIGGPAPAIPVIDFKQYPISQAPAVPLPTTMLLLGSGLAGLLGLRRKLKN